MNCSHQYLSVDKKKKIATPTLTPTNGPSMYTSLLFCTLLKKLFDVKKIV